MNTKICTSCKRELQLSCFYKNISRTDGHGSECKACHRAWRKLHYRNNKEATDATISRWRAENPEIYRALVNNGAKKNREKMKEIGIDGVYYKVHRAVRAGVLTPEPCRICGCNDVVAHHEDYEKPLDVLWYCQRHHMRLHQIVGSRKKYLTE